MKSFLKPLLFISLFVLVSFSYARVRTVPDPYQQIQWAIDASQNGDTVSVWTEEPGGQIPRTYHENINFSGKNILVVNRSYITTVPGYPPNPSYIVIDGGHNHSAVYFISGESQDAILRGFTIINGIGFNNPNGIGGGINCILSSPKIEHNIIMNNGGDDNTFRGGGISIDGDYERPERTCPVIFNNIIQNNQAHEFGGGIFYRYAKAEIIDNEIVGNSIFEGGGGLAGVWDAAGTIIRGNLIISNSAVSGTKGRALYFDNSNAILRNNKICHNNTSNPQYNSGIYCEGHSSPDFGDIDGENGPGYNWIYDNGSIDIHFYEGGSLMAEGNYWATLNTNDIRNRIQMDQGVAYFDPIAASDRVASVRGYQICETSVIVTGDLTVTGGVPLNTLTITAGNSFYFTTTDDAGTGNYKSCELLVDGGLQANGTEAENIIFTVLFQHILDKLVKIDFAPLGLCSN
jgi:hypothetical protein